LNLGFFESVIWTNTNDRGFDASFINPIVFTGQLSLHLQREREMLLGLTYIKWSDQINIYGQFLLMNFLWEILKGDNSWKINMDFPVGCQIL
jgi:hypothetical protein